MAFDHAAHELPTYGQIISPEKKTKKVLPPMSAGYTEHDYNTYTMTDVR